MIRILPLELDRTMFCLYDDAKLLAKCYYSAETGEILNIEFVDETAAKPLRVALIKAVMSSMEYAGVSVAWCRDQTLFPVLKALKFQMQGEDRMAVPLEGYFDTACECHSNQ